jgi:hypothetical protein
MRFSLIAFAAFALSGCASQEPVITGVTAPTVLASNSTTLTPESKLVCHKESPIGSNMIHTVCETEQSAAERNALQEQMRNRTPSNPAAGGR